MTTTIEVWILLVWWPPNPIRYRGYYYDTETKLYYLQSRCYSPEFRRFLNADSQFDTGSSILGTNMYCYAHNDPINYADPSGMVPSSIIRLVERLLGWDLFPQEKTFINQHPSMAVNIFRLAYTAEIAAAKLFTRTDGTIGNAFQHAFWSGLITLRYGTQIAMEYTAAHEGYSADVYSKISYTQKDGKVTAVKGPSKDLNTNMDLHNNLVGIGLGFFVRTLFGSYSKTNVNILSNLLQNSMNALYWYR